MPSITPAGATGRDDLTIRVAAGLRAFGAALRDVWQGYWDRPIGC